MPIVLAGIVALLVIALVAVPLLAGRLAGSAVAQPVVVAQTKLAPGGALESTGTVTGTVLIKLATGAAVKSIGKIDKWDVAMVDCSDVSVVATDAAGVEVGRARTSASPGDKMACVYSMKVPAKKPIGVTAILGSAKSIGVKGETKLADGTFADAKIVSDAATQNLVKGGALKSDAKLFTLAPSDSVTYPITLDVSN